MDANGLQTAQQHLVSCWATIDNACMKMFMVQKIQKKKSTLRSPFKHFTEGFSVGFTDRDNLVANANPVFLNMVNFVN